VRPHNKQIAATIRLIAGAALVSLFCAAAPTAACDDEPGPAASFARNPPLPGFTFDVDVAMAMRHFPWLHFHVEGIGKYEPGKAYVVHFTKLPWFAPSQTHDTDLAMLEPAMWPSRFLYQEAGQEDGNTLFDLRAIDDPSLKSATVALGPKLCARQIDALYNDGTQIKMNVTFRPVNGFLLPAALTADIDEPHMPLSASAQFKDYSFGVQSARAQIPSDE
jgi:hypothetical protein